MRDAIYRVIQVYGNTDPLSSGKRTILDRNILYGVIQKRFGSRRSKSRVQNDLRFHDAPLRRLTSKLPLVCAVGYDAPVDDHFLYSGLEAEPEIAGCYQLLVIVRIAPLDRSVQVDQPVFAVDFDVGRFSGDRDDPSVPTPSQVWPFQKILPMPLQKYIGPVANVAIAKNAG